MTFRSEVSDIVFPSLSPQWAPKVYSRSYTRVHPSTVILTAIHDCLGYYYIKYNHFDSYPEGLGQDLVRAIPALEKKFEGQSFIRIIRYQYSSSSVEWLESQRKFCENVVPSDMYDGYEKSTSPPKNDLFIEWTYTYDLDNLLFIVDSNAHFSLRGIAQKSEDEWIQFIDTDARGNRCLGLGTPPDLVGQFGRVAELFLGKDPIPTVGDFVPTSTISPSIWSKPLTRHHQRLMVAQVHATVAETYSILSTLTEAGVQDLAMPFLEAIVPNNQAIVLNCHSPTLDIFKAASGDRSPWFSYRGCLILLATHLDDNERYQVYVQAVAARAKAKNQDRCTALLWSIRHVAVVEISGDTVSHSGPIPLLAAYGSDEKGFTNALHLLWHYLPDPRWRIVEEQSTSPGAGSSNFGSLPTEIVLKIMMFTDQLHYPKYQFLSRNFFKLWWKHLRVGPYTILPDAEEVAETSRSFRAYSADENVPVQLQLKVLWGTHSENIWRSDEKPKGDEPSTIWWSLHCREKERRDEKEDFSRGSPRYRLQRFCSYWPEVLRAKKYSLPKVIDPFSGKSDTIFCEAQPI